jgi:hypothetical protein
MGVNKMDEKMDERTDTENCEFVVKEFSNRGIPVDEIKPKENVFTFGKWIKRGRSVRRGETGVKICWLARMVKETKNGDKTTFRHIYRSVFHISQTDKIQLVA